MPTEIPETPQISFESDTIPPEPIIDIPAPSIQITKKRDVDVKAEQRIEARRLPKVPGRNLTLKQLMDWMELLTEEMWSHVIIYFYRYKPEILRELSDPTNYKYIDVLSEKFDEQYIIDNHGGGVYSIDVCDKDSPKGSNIAKCIHKIDMTKHAPILNYAELDLRSKANIPYINLLKAKGILDNEGKPVMNPAVAASQHSQNATLDMMREFMGFFSKLNAEQKAELKSELSRVSNSDSGLKPIVDLLIEKMKQESPTNILSVITAIKDIFPKPDSTNGMVQQVFELLGKVIEKQSVPPTAATSNVADPYETINKALDLNQKLTELRGDGAPQGKVTWQDRLIDGLERVGLPIMQKVAEGWAWHQMAKAQTGMGNDPSTGNKPSNVTEINKGGVRTNNPFNNPELRIAPPETIMQPQPTQNTNTTQNPNIQVTPDQEIAQLIMQYGMYIANAICGGTPGYEAGFDVSRVAGIVIHSRIRQLGVEKLISVAKQIPDFWSTVSGVGEDVVRKWIEEFVDFEKYIPKDE